MRILVGGLLLCPWFAASAAAIEHVKIDAITAHLELPAGYCRLSRSNPVERQLYEMQDRIQTGINIVALISVPCDKIKALRRGNMTPQYGIWLLQAPGGLPSRVPTGVSRDQVFEALAKAITELDTGKISASIQSRGAKEGIAYSVTASGLIDKDRNGVYLGMTGRLRRVSGMADIASVAGLTMIWGRRFSFNLYDDFSGGETFDRLLATVKSTLARSSAANPVMSPETAGPVKALPPGMQPVRPPPVNRTPATPQQDALIPARQPAAA